MQTCGVILAGGKSSRMGQNKALLPIQNKPVIEWIYQSIIEIVQEVIIITNNPDEYAFLSVPIYEDFFINKGPLAGLDSAFNHTSSDQILVTACDTPLVQPEVFEHLIQINKHHDITVPIHRETLHPMSAVYKKSVHPIIYNQLLNDNLKVRNVFNQVNTYYEKEFSNIKEPILEKHFFNMNYPEEYESIKNFKI